MSKMSVGEMKWNTKKVYSMPKTQVRTNRKTKGMGQITIKLNFCMFTIEIYK